MSFLDILKFGFHLEQEIRVLRSIAMQIDISVMLIT